MNVVYAPGLFYATALPLPVSHLIKLQPPVGISSAPRLQTKDFSRNRTSTCKFRLGPADQSTLRLGMTSSRCVINEDRNMLSLG